MTLRSRSALAALVAVALTGAVLLTAPSPAQAAPRTYEVTSTKVDATVSDGTVVKGTLSIPQGPTPSTGWPVVLMPGTFGGTAVDATAFGALMAQRGYLVYAYYERGFGGTGGVVDGGGPDDVRDVSDLITWMLRTYPTDPKRVGVTGLSYGAGIGMMAGIVDARIKAVAAMSGWADMTESFYPNKTVNMLSLQGLYLDASVFGKPSAQITKAFDGLSSGNVADGLEFTRIRGASYYRDTFGQHRATAPALYISEPMNEGVFPILGTTKYWESYPGRKHFELRAGDHGDPEWLTTFGIPTDSWTNAFRWMDANVGGWDTSINAEPQVLVVPRSSNGSRPTERRTTTLNGPTQRYFLTGRPRMFGNDSGVLAPTAGTRTTTIQEGQEWLVRNSIPILAFGVESATGVPPLVALGGVNPDVTSIWRTPSLTSTLKLRGEVGAHLQLTPTASKGTVVVHVLDVDALGNTFMVAHHPYSWDSATPGKAFTADFSLPYNAYDFPPLHKMVVTVSTSDTTYTSANPTGAKVTLGTGTYVDVPTIK